MACAQTRAQSAFNEEEKAKMGLEMFAVFVGMSWGLS
jgi:hypothetical protein